MPTKLGQNFLTNENIARQIADFPNINEKNVLEIGPGKGMLTKYISEKARKVLAIEIDKGLAMLLKTKLILSKESCRSARCKAENRGGNIAIIEGDILKINLPKLIEENNFQNYKVVANLPYYITSKIIRLLLETKYPPSEMILMVQKEVGERIVAKDGKESLLSISVKFYADPKILFEVPRENFEPAPEVDSVVICITRKKNPPKPDTSEFFALVRAGFSAKRKTLLNNLSSGLGMTKIEAAEIIKKAGLDPTIRAEKLGVAEWMKLSSELKM